MSYDGVNVTDAGTLAALRGVAGIGYGHGNFLGDGSAVKESVRGNRDIALLDAVNRGTNEGFISNQISRGNASIHESINQHNDATSRLFSFQNVNERFSGLERIMFSQQADAQRDRTEIIRAVDAVKCCCEANSAKIDNLAIISTKDLEITKLQLQLANGNGGHGHGNS